MKQFYILTLLSILLIPSLTKAQITPLVVKEFQAGELPPHQRKPFSNAITTHFVQFDLPQIQLHNQVEINFAGFTALQLQFERLYRYTAGGESFIAKGSSPDDYLIMSFFHNAINGIMVCHGQRYMIQQISQTDIMAISLVATESMQETDSGISDVIPMDGRAKKTRANPDVCAIGTSCPGANQIDLMVLGNADAVVDAGGTVALLIANATSAVTEMNLAYSNSGGTNLTFNLLHADAIAFTPTSSSSADLGTFASTPSVNTLRDTYGADLVSLWVGSGTYSGACGIGYLNSNPTNYNDAAAYTVCDYNCAMTNLTFAHECGHNMGLRHDYFVDASTTPCSHHHGYVNQMVIPGGSPSSGRWRTIMAYNDECATNGFNCTRLARWSNPTLNYLGDPTGIAIGLSEPSYEIYGFERMRCVVSEFRSASVVPVNLINFSGSAEAQEIVLTWQTANESNNHGFDIELKNEISNEFESLGFVAGKGTSAELNYYEHRIKNLLPGTYLLRLKQTDIDGKSMYSQVIQVQIDGNNWAYQIYPNPISRSFNLDLFVPQTQPISFQLLDVMGHTVLQLENDIITKGRHSFQYHVNLPEGIYRGVIKGKENMTTFNVVIKE